MISICVAIKNRTKVITKDGIQLNLFKNSIISLNDKNIYTEIFFTELFQNL